MKHLAVFTTLSLLAGTPAFGSDPYGQLFTTPVQRAQLDNRFTASSNTGEAETSVTAVSDRQAPASLQLNGMLTSSTGKKEVWINGRRQLGDAFGSAARVSVLGPDAVQVRPALSARGRAMKPGQIMDLASGEISEAYTSGKRTQDR